VVVSLFGCSSDQQDYLDLTTGAELYTYHFIVPSVMEEENGTLFDGMPANIFTKKSPKEIITYLTTQTHHDRKMPVFKMMPAYKA